MSIVDEFTREQWKALGGWRHVESYVDGVVLAFSDDLDTQLQVDAAAEEGRVLVPTRYYTRSEDGNGFVLEEESLEDRTPKEQTA